MKYFIFVILFLLASCGSTKLVYVDRIVEVPKIVFKDPPKIANVYKPQLMIYTLTEKSTNDQFFKSCIISLEQSIDYSKKLEIAIKPFKGNK